MVITKIVKKETTFFDCRRNRLQFGRWKTFFYIYMRKNQASFCQRFPKWCMWTNARMWAVPEMWTNARVWAVPEVWTIMRGCELYLKCELMRGCELYLKCLVMPSDLLRILTGNKIQVSQIHCWIKLRNQRCSFCFCCCFLNLVFMANP